MSIDIKNITPDDLNRMFALGMISYNDIREVLDKRGLRMTISGDIETKDGEPYPGPIKNRWEILDFS